MTVRATFITIDEFKAHLDRVNERLERERQSIAEYAPAPTDMPRESYAFAYLRAERIALRSINRRLDALSWMPIQLNPQIDLQDSRRESMKRWIKTELSAPADADSFGNELVHALARCGIAHEWDGAECAHMAMRIATLFQDMACLVALIQYSIWLNDRGIAGLSLSDVDNLSLCLCDIVSFIHTSALYNYLRTREEESERLRRQRAHRLQRDKSSRKSFLRLVEAHPPADAQDSA